VFTDIVGLAGIAIGNHKPAGDREHGQRHLIRLLGEMRIAYESAAKVLDELAGAVRRSLSGLVHNRREAWPMTQFRPGDASTPGSGTKPTAMPTEEGPLRGPRRQ
jgi:hypothetical protein